MQTNLTYYFFFIFPLSFPCFILITAVICIRADSVTGHWLLSSARKYRNELNWIELCGTINTQFSIYWIVTCRYVTHTIQIYEFHFFFYYIRIINDYGILDSLQIFMWNV
jgi:hypothetical protein